MCCSALLICILLHRTGTTQTWRGIQFHSTAHVPTINAETSRNPYWSSQAYWCAATALLQWHTARHHGLLYQKQMPKETNFQIGSTPKSNTCRFNSFKRKNCLTVSTQISWLQTEPWTKHTNATRAHKAKTLEHITNQLDLNLFDYFF